MLKKILLSFLSSLVILFSFAPYLTVKAAAPPAPSSPWYNPSFFDFYDKVYNETTSPQGEIFGERYTAAQMNWVFYSVISGIINMPYTIMAFFGVEVKSPTPTVCILGALHKSIDITTCVQSVGNVFSAFIDRFASAPPSTDYANSNQNLWADVFSNQRSLSFINYASNFVGKLNPVTEVHAQATSGGFGFTRLLIISDIWTVSRNAAYAVFVIAIIAIAFMIMFRVKISPQAVISVQSAIPRIALTLILITFSLAIAGLMVDLMYVVIGIIASLLPTGFSTLAFSPNDAYRFLTGSVAGHGDAILNLLLWSFWYIVSYIVTTVVVILTSVLTLNVSSFIFAALMLLFTIIIFFILVWNLFKITYILLKTTAQIYVAVIVGPLQLMMGVFPGQLGANAFSGWLKSLASKLAVFPVTGLLMFFASRFLGMAFVLAIQGLTNAYGGPGVALLGRDACYRVWGQNAGVCNFFLGSQFANGSNFWGPPLLGDSGAVTGLVFLLISVGAIMSIGKVPEMIEAFLAGKAIGPSAVGEAIGPIGAGGTAFVASKLSEGAVPPGLGGIPLLGKYLGGLKDEDRKKLGTLLSNIQRALGH